jgi:hypothetical protein
MDQPIALLSVQRRGRRHDEDAVIVTTTRDSANSHQAAYDAIRRAGIRPSYVRAGTIRVTFDPSELRQTQAEAIVEEALRAGGVRIYR